MSDKDNSDKNLPVSGFFMGIVDDAQNKELEALEAQHKKTRELEETLRKKRNDGMSLNQMVMNGGIIAKDEGEKVLKALDKVRRDSEKAVEKRRLGEGKEGISRMPPPELE